jgi:hypothetical protein
MPRRARRGRSRTNLPMYRAKECARPHHFGWRRTWRPSVICLAIGAKLPFGKVGQPRYLDFWWMHLDARVFSEYFEWSYIKNGLRMKNNMVVLVNTA